MRRMSRPNLFGMGSDALAAAVAELGEPAYRARQLYGWLYGRRVKDVAAMANLPRVLRERLEERFALRWPEVAERKLSFDGTRKYLFRLDDGATIEAVYIPEAERRTICISTQAGCPLKCAFCLTGIAGYTRNLDAGEILGQVATVMEEHPVTRTHPHRREDDPFPWNMVVMGMGEPLLNYDATVAALRVLMDPRRLRRAAAQAHALDGRHPARARASRPRAGAAEPRDQPARPRPGTAPRADADRGEVPDERRDRRGAALRGPPRRRGHVRVRAARRRQRHPGPRARARPPPRGRAARRST